MPELFNIYCDESCHLERDQSSVMVLGAVWCKASRTKEIADRLREIKQKHLLARTDEWKQPGGMPFEVKWSKVSQGQVDFYLDLIDYFFDDDDLHFRGMLIPDKRILDHASFDQSHDDWYYKMLFRLLEPVIDPEQQYHIYLDIKDTQSERTRAKLQEVLRHSRYDPLGMIIHRVQQIRSHESELMQMADLLLGAIGYHNRQRRDELPTPGKSLNPAKLEVIRRIQRRSDKSLDQTTWLRESKLNLLRWKPRGSSQ